MGKSQFLRETSKKGIVPSMTLFNGSKRKTATWLLVLVAVYAVMQFLATLEDTIAFLGHAEQWLYVIHANHAYAAIVQLVVIVGLLVLTGLILAVYKSGAHGRKRIHEKLDEESDIRQKEFSMLREWKGATDARLIRLEDHQRADIAIAKMAERENTDGTKTT